MEPANLKIHAVVFDVYGTLLEVGPPPKNADARWRRLFEAFLSAPPPLTRIQFYTRTGRIIARLHAAAKARGIRWPEVVWPSVVLEVLPTLARLSESKRDDFILQQMQIGRTLQLNPNAGECLRQLNDEQIPLGIASNSQAYTLRELDTALQDAGLNLSMFDPELRFWSFEHGFSKPDPHVFRMLTTRLEARGVAPGETLMVGDRLDNDIAPARPHGWQTWQITRSVGRGGSAGSWRQLRAFLAA